MTCPVLVLLVDISLKRDELAVYFSVVGDGNAVDTVEVFRHFIVQQIVTHICAQLLFVNIDTGSKIESVQFSFPVAFACHRFDKATINTGEFRHTSLYLSELYAERADLAHKVCTTNINKLAFFIELGKIACVVKNAVIRVIGEGILNKLLGSEIGSVAVTSADDLTGEADLAHLTDLGDRCKIVLQ